MTPDHWEGRVAPEKARKISDNPFAPDHPRWKEWNRSFLHVYPHTIRGAQNRLASHRRIQAVEDSIKAQRTDKQGWAEDVMREVESYNQWKDRGQGRISIFVGSRNIASQVVSIGFSGMGGGGGSGYSHRLGALGPAWQYFPDPNPDLLRGLFTSLGSAFGAAVDIVKQAFNDIWELLQSVIEENKAKSHRPRGWIPDPCFAPLPDVWSWFDDERPHIAASTWRQYDSI